MSDDKIGWLSEDDSRRCLEDKEDGRRGKDFYVSQAI